MRYASRSVEVVGITKCATMYVVKSLKKKRRRGREGNDVTKKKNGNHRLN